MVFKRFSLKKIQKKPTIMIHCLFIASMQTTQSLCCVIVNGLPNGNARSNIEYSLNTVCIKNKNECILKTNLEMRDKPHPAFKTGRTI